MLQLLYFFFLAHDHPSSSEDNFIFIQAWVYNNNNNNKRFKQFRNPLTITQQIKQNKTTKDKQLYSEDGEMKSEIVTNRRTFETF